MPRLVAQDAHAPLVVAASDFEHLGSIEPLAEAAVQGKPRNRETGELAGAFAIEGAQPLAHNAYKIPLLRNLVKRAILGEATHT